VIPWRIAGWSSPPLIAQFRINCPSVQPLTAQFAGDMPELAKN
jgi:hypothetical protein